MFLIEKSFNQNIELSELTLKKIKKNIIDGSLIIKKKVSNKKNIFWCGNGGSAADAQHLATELMGGMISHERKPIPSIALTTDNSFITAWSNDTDFESIFSRQVQGIGNNGDVLIGISTSGNSENVHAAIKQAQYKGLSTILFTGKSGGKMNGISEITINVPSEDTQRIQEAHIMVGQILCSLIEDDLLKG